LNQDDLFTLSLNHTPVNGRNKAIPSACQRLNVAGLLGGVIQRRSQPFNRRVQAVFKIDKCVLRPELFLQFLPRHQFPRSLQKHLQDGQRLAFQADAHSFFAQFPRVRVELVRPETDDIRFR
jgi:hypothetical protein